MFVLHAGVVGAPSTTDVHGGALRTNSPNSGPRSFALYLYVVVLGCCGVDLVGGLRLSFGAFFGNHVRLSALGQEQEPP